MSTNDPADTDSRAVSLSDEDAVTRILVNSVLGLWDVVNDLTRLKPARRDRYRVTIFGSAQAQAGTLEYEETKRTAAALAAMGCDIITGGGPGLMQAANEGAASSGRAQSIGIRVDLPDVLHAPPSIRSRLGCVRDRTWRHRYSPRDDDDLATAAGRAHSGHSADSHRTDVARAVGLGPRIDALYGPSIGQRGGPLNPAVRRDCRRSDRAPA